MRRGFTLIELVIVLALIALVGGLVVINAQAILRGLGQEPVDRVLQKAVREARYQAAYLKESVYLSFDEEESALEVSSETGQSLARFPLEEDDGEIPEIAFEQILPGTGLDRYRLETVPISNVVFRPDRSSTPFEAVVEGKSQTFTQRFDPFSAIVTYDSREQ